MQNSSYLPLLLQYNDNLSVLDRLLGAAGSTNTVQPSIVSASPHQLLLDSLANSHSSGSNPIINNQSLSLGSISHDELALAILQNQLQEEQRARDQKQLLDLQTRLAAAAQQPPPVVNTDTTITNTNSRTISEALAIAGLAEMANTESPLSTRIRTETLNLSPSTTTTATQAVIQGLAGASGGTTGAIATTTANTEGLSSDLSVERRKGRTGTFPQKLHQMLADLEEEGNSDIAAFLPGGRAFIIHKPKEFADIVMGKYFRMSRFSSFQRQLNLYDFQRISEGQEKGAYFHELFLQSQPMMCTLMKRNKIKGTKGLVNNGRHGSP